MKTTPQNPTRNRFLVRSRLRALVAAGLVRAERNSAGKVVFVLTAKGRQALQQIETFKSVEGDLAQALKRAAVLAGR
jgi:DNA-binding MarR family transcriptional regulator